MEGYTKDTVYKSEERVGEPMVSYAMHSFVRSEVGIEPETPYFITIKEYNDAELVMRVQVGDGWGDDEHDYDLVWLPSKAEAMRLRNALKKAQVQLTQWMREHRRRGGDW